MSIYKKKKLFIQFPYSNTFGLKNRLSKDISYKTSIYFAQNLFAILENPNEREAQLFTVRHQVEVHNGNRNVPNLLISVKS